MRVFVKRKSEKFIHEIHEKHEKHKKGLTTKDEETVSKVPS
jgi:hypothetical protein